MIDETAHKIQRNQHSRFWLRFLEPAWSVALVLLVAFFAWRQRADLAHAVQETRLADPRWLVVLVASAILMHALVTQTLSSVLRRIGRRIPYLPALMTHAEREMIATVMPLGGAASFVTLVMRFGVYGVTRNDAVLAVMLYSIIGHLSFLLVALPALTWLVAQHNASGPVWIGAVVVLASAIVFVWLVTALLGGRRLPRIVEARVPQPINDFRSQARTITITVRSMLVPYLLSVAADLFGVVGMWGALRALNVHAGLELALVGYTVGTLLMLAAPVFQGIGIVEVSVVYILQQLGVGLPQAIGATILYRFVDVWLPVILGVGVHARYQRALRGIPAYLPALWTGLSGVLALASLVPVRFHIRGLDMKRADGIALLYPQQARHTITLVAGFLLVLLSIRLMRRQHSAWVVSLLLSIAVGIVSLTRDVDSSLAIISGVNVALLLLYRRRFRVRSDIPTIRRGLAVILVSICVTYAYGVLNLWLADRQHFGHEFSIRSSLRLARDVYLGFNDAGLNPRTGRAEWTLDSMHLLAVLSIVVSAFAILQPIVWRARVQQSDIERARNIITQWGDSALDRFKYWPDKHQFFALDGHGVVSYGLSGRVALVLGDPTARDSEAFEKTLDEFLDFCDLNGWEPAFHQTPSTHLGSYRRRGFSPMIIGQDAIIRVKDFSLAGGSMKNLRTLSNRARREGTRVEHIEPPLSTELLQELEEISRSWLTLEGRRERTFTLGQFSHSYISECPVLVLRSPGGRAEAFINLIRSGTGEEMSLDLMRHRRDALNGAMDLLILALIDLAASQGCETVSLGMVPFVNPEPEDIAGADRAISRLARPMQRFFASESLFAYKKKFHPDWEPRYLVVRSMAQLPRAALALTRLAEIHDQGPLGVLAGRRQPMQQGRGVPARNDRA